MSVLTARPRLTRPAAPPRRAFLLLGYAAIVLLAFVIRVRLLSHGVGFAASDGYDDGVYYAAADALIHGRLPYRDFLLLHPPGIVLTLTPFAWLGSVTVDHLGAGVARLAFAAIGAVNVALVMRLAARHSRRAAVVAGVAAATWYPLAYTERSTLLEPLGNLLVLAAAAVLARSRPGKGVLAGVLVGLAVTVKIWYLVPALVLLVVARRRLPFAGGAAAAMTVVLGPFFLAAPARMVQEVVLDQFGRPRTSSAGLVRRLTTILTDPRLPSNGAVDLVQVVAAVIGGSLLVAMVLAWRQRWPRVYAVLALSAVAVLLAGPSFFLHYAAFPTPWLAVCLGIGAAAAMRPLQQRWVVANVVALLCTGLVAVNVSALTHVRPQPQPVRQLRPMLAASVGCVVSDDPGLLANTDVLSRDLAAGCPLWPDVTGWTYDRDGARTVDGRAVPRASNLGWQRHVMGYLLSGDVVILARSGTGLSAASQARIDALPVIGRAGGLTAHRIP